MGRLVLPCLLFFALLAPAAQAETLKYRFGPIHISPGRNDIVFELNDQRPPVDGWITGFKPNLIYTDGRVPRVDVVHLHHGVWLMNGAPEFAAGEEKTEIRAPAGYGWRYRTSDSWVMNHMIHNLTPSAADVYITYDLEFVPATSPQAAGMKEVRTMFLDSRGIRAYPVFDVHRGAGGRDGRYTFPRESKQPGYTLNRYRVPEDGELVGAAGHLHPGGLWTDLVLERGGKRVRLFRSNAKYFEPAGAVSWDVAMEVTPPDWRVGGQARRHPRGVGDLRLQARVVVRGDGDHADHVPPRGGRGGPVRGEHRSQGPVHARAPGREPQPRRRVLRAGRPAAPAVGTAAAAAHRRDQGLPVRPRRPAARRQRGGARRRSGPAAR